LFEQAGLSIVDHEMHIGFFANTAAALVQLPLVLGGRVARKLGYENGAHGLAQKIIERGPQTRAMDFFDRHTEPLLRGLYGWNSFVLAKKRGL
jgi:hypothetical protein